MAEQRKVYTMDEIRKLAPGYRGKAENFDPSKLGRKRESAPPKPKAVSRTPHPVVQIYRHLRTLNANQLRRGIRR
jgi:hypothetical protein